MRVGADQFSFVFGAVGKGNGDLFNRSAARWRDDVVVGHHIAVCRNEEARAERLAFAELRFLLLLIAIAAVEQFFERRAFERVAAVAVSNFDALAGRDVDHGRLQLFGEVGEAGRCACARDHIGHLRIVILGDLSAGGVSGDGKGCASG